jgi:hypothetical protein
MRRTVMVVLVGGLLGLGGLAGCLAESAQGPAYSSAGPGAPVCSDERPTGTHLVRRVCRTQDAAAQDQAAMRSWMNYWRPNPLFGDHTYPGIDVRHVHDHD